MAAIFVCLHFKGCFPPFLFGEHQMAAVVAAILFVVDSSVKHWSSWGEDMPPQQGCEQLVETQIRT